MTLRLALFALFALFATLLLAACADLPLALVDPPPPAGEGEGEGASSSEGEGEGEGGGEGEGIGPCQPDLAYPVKVLFVFDVSGSMQFTDQGGLSRNTLFATVNHLQSLSNVFATTMAFGSNVYTDPAVTPGNDALFAPIAGWTPSPLLTVKDVTSSLHVALHGAFEHIFTDANLTPADVRARTRYVVVVFTDGATDPVCCADGGSASVSDNDPFPSCGVPTWLQAASGPFCEAQPENQVCTQQDALDNFRTNVASSITSVDPSSGNTSPIDIATYVPDYGEGPLPFLDGLAVGHDYDRVSDLENEVRLLTSLKGLGIGAVDVHFGFVEDSSLSDIVKQTFALDACRQSAALRALADAAHGTFADIDQGDPIVVDSDFAPLCIP